MNWVKSNWGWLTVIALGLIPLIEVLGMIRIDFSGASETWFSMDTVTMPGRRHGEAAHPVPGAHVAVKETGEWAIRWIVVILSMTPFAILTGKKPSLWVRQAAGITAFIYAGLHFLFFCIDKSFMETFGSISFILGLIATLIMLVLAVTSSTKAMKFLRKSWKKLHRFAYLAGVLAVLHVALLDHGDWFPYLVILAVGFVLRTKVMKEWFVLRRNKRSLQRV
ncbi:MAG TPA: ferric reductase-like transmembrane domain-containing protein [Prolixibacteraceae bacterium]|nr:ferric reductase-like transmembrane domain-containing protein [Prolixibacteraceae bacterium]